MTGQEETALDDSYASMVQNLVLPFNDLIRGTSRFRKGRTLQKTQWFRRDEIERLQNRNLRALMKHAYQTVPYYRRVFRERHLIPEDIKDPQGLIKLPQLTKEDIQKNPQEFVSVNYPRSGLLPYQSGGSGNPIRFFITKDSYSWEIAAEFRAYAWAGYRLGDRCFMLWGSPMDITRASAAFRKINQSLERILIANTFVLSDKFFEKSVQALRKFRPKIIRGYASSVFMLAKYMKDQGLGGIRPASIITSAETLESSMRKTIEDAFGCSVYDYYGSRETGAIASECEEHHGYHVSSENVVVEFVDDNEPVAAGERGIELITNLRNMGMPFVRYRIGDIGIPSADPCNCGRGLPLLSSIEGRMSDFMACTDQVHHRVVPIGPIYPVIISIAMYLPIKNCQVVQEQIDKLTVKVVKGKGYSDEDTERLIEHMQKELGSSIRIAVEFVESIPALPSGKRSVFISKIDPFKVSSEAKSS